MHKLVFHGAHVAVGGQLAGGSSFSGERAQVVGIGGKRPYHLAALVSLYFGTKNACVECRK